LFLFFLPQAWLVQPNNRTTEQPDINHWYQFTFENDVMALVNASDDGYINGLSYAWGRSQYDSFESLDIPQWIRYISDWTFINQGGSKAYALSYGLSQSMYIPMLPQGTLSGTSLISRARRNKS
jgi:lipid A 3-O-deacylase